MMDEPAGPHAPMSETLQDAISFRKAMSSIAHRLRAAEQGWFFRLYQPEYVFDPLDGKTYYSSKKAADGLLTNRSSAWTLKVGEELARLPGRGHRRRLLHARSHQGYDSHAGRQLAGRRQ